MGFANADGGDIVVGLSDGQLEGLGKVSLAEYQQTPMDFTVPPVRAEFVPLECLDRDGKPTQLLAIRVAPSERIHELTNGDCYLRVGDETKKLRSHERRELEFDKGQAQFDGFGTDATLADLDFKSLEEFRDTVGSGTPVEHLLRSLYLVDNNDRLTNAAVLLFGKTPQQWFPEAYVRIIRFAGTERGTGARLNVVEGEDHRITGCHTERDCGS